MSMKIVVLDGATLNPGDNPWDGLRELGEVAVHARTAPERVGQRAQDAEILVVNKVRIDEPLLSGLPQLRMIAVTATGYDCVDVAAAGARGIPVSNVPVYGTDSVAQHTMALLLHLLHRVDLHDAAIRSGEWQRRGDFSFWLNPLVELTGKRFGIIGWGRIGRRVAELAVAFGMEVVATSRRIPESSSSSRVTFVPLDLLVESSDVISLHCPLTAETRGMVDQAFLSRMKPTAILLNASRGPLVVESDLAAALGAGRIGGAALDVVSIEPIRDDNPLLAAPNCILTPHLAWATREARQRLMQVTVANVAAFLAGQPQHVVNAASLRPRP